MLQALAAAAAVAAPLFSHTVPVKQVAVVDPDTLAPIAGSPRFPAGTDEVERSPDGARYAARTPHGLAIYDVATGARLRVIDVPVDRAVLSWIAPDRILLVKVYHQADVRTVDVATGQVTSTVPLNAEADDTVRYGDQQAVLVRHTGTTDLVDTFDGSGALLHSIEIKARFAGLDTSAPLVLDQRKHVWSLNLAAGTAKRQTLAVRGRAGDVSWVQPDTPGMVAVLSPQGVVTLDPATLAPLKTVPAPGTARGAGPGFMTFNYDRPEPLRVYDAAGNRVFALPKQRIYKAASFGDRLYTFPFDGNLDHRKIYDLNTGALTGVLPIDTGYYLFGIAGGRGPDRPYFNTLG